jgi:AcrR family transcriptional regulator
MSAEPEKKHPSLTREHILQAAVELVLTEGSSALTLEAAAKAAGVSKGGLLYHFPSKEALILGMIDARQEWLKTIIQEERRQLPQPDAPGSFHRALIHAGFKTFIACNDLTAGMLAVVAQDPAAIERIQQGVLELSALRDQDGIPRAISNLILSSMDGIKMHRVIGLPLPSQAEIDDLRNLLFQLIDQAVQSTAPTSNSRESA